MDGTVSSSRRDSSTDYRGVYGGPPTRAPFHEARRGSYNGNDWGFVDKPVFGDAGRGTKKLTKLDEDFYNDIFKLDDYELSATPRVQGGDMLFSWFSSGGPAPSLLSESDPKLTGGSSIPKAPCRQIKVTELATFPPGVLSELKSNYSMSKSSCSSVSKNSIQGQDSSAEVFGWKRQISKNSSPRSDESFRRMKNDLKDKVFKSERWLSGSDSDDSEVQRSNRFHFSIYKWASKGVPLSTRSRGSSNLVSKDKNILQSCSSFNGWLIADRMRKRVTSDASHDRDFPSFNSVSSSSMGFVAELDKEKGNQFVDAGNLSRRSDNGGRHTAGKQKIEDSILKSETEFPSHPMGTSATNELAGPVLDGVSNEIKFNSGVDWATNLCEANEPKIRRRNTPTVSACFDDANGRCAPKNIKFNNAKIKNGGKVKDFVNSFNLQAAKNEELCLNSHKDRKEKDKSKSIASPLRTGAKVSSHASINVPDKLVLEHTYDSSFEKWQMKENPPNGTNFTTAVTPVASNASEGVLDYDSDHSLFQFEELHNDPCAGGLLDAEEIKVVEKVQSWSKGKEGNIRSLLSTLQYVLWPGCGWMPVPLADIIEGNAVRKSYQKALLCLHPDKLQQKGAMGCEKVVAAMVFDILQEAWSHFSAVSLLS